MTPITIFPSDDHPIVRDGLRDIIEQQEGLVIVGEAGDGEETLVRIRASQPDVLLLDIEMPKMSGLDVARAIRDENIAVHILILTMYNQESIFNRAMDLGVAGYMLKDSAGEDIVRGIKAVMRGEYFISPSLSRYAMRGQKSAAEHPLSELTPAERKVLDLIADSRTTNQIAEILHLSPRTIEHHRERICNKLDLSGSYALLRYALENRDVLKR